MGAKSKQKGGRGERELCRKLEDIFGGSFIRSNNSGAFVGGKNAVRKEKLSENQLTSLKADIVPPDFMPKFVVESKLYKDFAYHQFIESKPIALLDGWIQQTLDCVNDNDFWIVAFRADRRAWAVAFDASNANLFEMPSTWINYTSGDGKKYIVTSFEDFLSINKDRILELTK